MANPKAKAAASPEQKGRTKRRPTARARAAGSASSDTANNGALHPLVTAAIGALLGIAAVYLFSGKGRQQSPPPSPSSVPRGAPNTSPSNEEFDDAVRAWSAHTIDRVPFSEMTHSRFAREHIGHRRPVVITGVYADSPLTEGVNENMWGWRAMRDRFGDMPLENRVMRSSGGGRNKGCTGTGLCRGKVITLGKLFDEHFLNDQKGGGAKNQMAPYPHDIQLETTLPEMFDVYKIPALFAENLLLPIKGGKNRWPSLFFGATGTRTNLHVDSMGTTFTMAVFRGRKQFLLFDPKDGPNLCMESPNAGLDYGVSLNPVPLAEEAGHRTGPGKDTGRAPENIPCHNPSGDPGSLFGGKGDVLAGSMTLPSSPNRLTCPHFGEFLFDPER